MRPKDLGHFQYQSAYEVIISWACVAVAHILTLYCSEKLEQFLEGNLLKMHGRPTCSTISLYVIVIPVPVPFIEIFNTRHIKNLRGQM